MNDGTAQMTIASLMFFLGYLCDVSPVLEQPLGSCMARAAPMSTSLKFTKAVKTVTWHGAFGASSLKPLQLWSRRDCIQELVVLNGPQAIIHQRCKLQNMQVSAQQATEGCGHPTAARGRENVSFQTQPPPLYMLHCRAPPTSVHVAGLSLDWRGWSRFIFTCTSGYTYM